MTAEPYTDAELEAFRADHHHCCSSRQGGECDCYHRRCHSRLLATVDAGREREAKEVMRLEAVVTALKAERDRLRAALEQIAWLPSSHTNVTGGVTSVPMDDARKIARAALKEKP